MTESFPGQVLQTEDIKNIWANFHQFHKSFKFQANCEKLSFNFLISNTHGINLFPQIDLFPQYSLS